MDSLKKPVHARKLEVGFFGKAKDSRSGVSAVTIATGKARPTHSTTYHTIYDFRIPLDGEKDDKQGEYPFEIKIPENIHQHDNKLEGAAGQSCSSQSTWWHVHPY